MLLRLGELGRLADDALDRALRVLLLLVRHRLVRRVRHLREQLVPRRLGRRELVLEPPQLLLDLLQLLDLLGRRLALDLLAPAKLVHLRDELAPARVRLEQPVEGLAGPLARDRGPEARPARPAQP